MTNAPDKFDNQQNSADEQDRDQDLAYRQNRPKARPKDDNAFDRAGSVDPQGAEAERHPSESLTPEEAAEADRDK